MLRYVDNLWNLPGKESFSICNFYFYNILNFTILKYVFLLLDESPEIEKFSPPATHSSATLGPCMDHEHLHISIWIYLRLCYLRGDNWYITLSYHHLHFTAEESLFIFCCRKKIFGFIYCCCENWTFQRFHQIVIFHSRTS